MNVDNIGRVIQKELPKLPLHSDRWDLVDLVSIFHKKEDLFRHDFECEFRHVIPMLMQIKEMRSRRIHVKKPTLQILAREAHKIAEATCSFFEMMRDDSPYKF